MTKETSSDDEPGLPTMAELRRLATSRRSVLVGAGAAIGTGILGASGSTLAQEDDDEGAGQFSQPNTDTDVLRYALTLERLEESFYETGLGAFDEDDFQAASTLEPFGDEVTQAVPAYIATAAEQEATHVQQLERVLEVLGADPGEAPAFEFEFETVDEYLATAQVLENTGVAAYAGVAPSIESPDILSAALSIHSVEARHAGYLNLLLGELPYPDAFDAALSIEEVLSAIEPFFPSEETPTETPEETPTETPEETPTETPEGTPTETPEETPTETPEGTPTEIPAETPTEPITGTPTETPTGTPNGS